MASPHTAGLLAYYLSLQGSATFNPKLESLVNAPNAAQLTSWNPTAAIMAVLPRWMSAFIPVSQAIQEVLPTSDDDASFYKDGFLDVTQFGGITPAQLKGALLDIGLSGKISDLPPKTVNLLIFNNATDSHGKKWTF